MSKSYDWTVSVINSDGVTWDVDTSWPRPNQDMERQWVSTMQTIKLANGGEGFVTPEVRRTKEAFSFFWADTTAAFRAQLEGYANFGEKIKITTHTGEIFIGMILDYKRVWFSGIESEFDVMITFKCME